MIGWFFNQLLEFLYYGCLAIGLAGFVVSIVTPWLLGPSSLLLKWASVALCLFGADGIRITYHDARRDAEIRTSVAAELAIDNQNNIEELARVHADELTRARGTSAAKQVVYRNVETNSCGAAPRINATLDELRKRAGSRGSSNPR